MKHIFIPAILSLVLFSCKSNRMINDAAGSFEAVETIVSAEATGTLKEFKIEEGDNVQIGQQVGYVDTVQLYLKKKQLEAQIIATGNRVPDVPVQTGFYKQQSAVTQSSLDYLLHEQKRLENLVKANAAPQKQLDDINAKIDETQKQLTVINKQEFAQVSALQTQLSSYKSDIQPLIIQVQQLNDQLQKSRIVNPVKGTVLTKYAEVNEMTSLGKPLYKVADLSTIILRAYITGNQLSAVKLNQQVNVLVDDSTGKYKTYQGIVEWISNKAEFTPKTIQTKDERANLVYAVKIRVKNDDYIKIGMYGEVNF